MKIDTAIISTLNAAKARITSLVVENDVTLPGQSIPNAALAGGITADKLAFKTTTWIAETILGADTALVTFSSIPQVYRNLILEITGRKKNNAGAGHNVAVRPNGDSGANYDYVTGYGYGGATPATITYETLADTMWQLGWLADDTAPAGQSGSAVIRIMDYARTAWRKNVIADFGASYQTTGNIWWITTRGTWRSTAAITSLNILDSGGNNFAAGTVFTLRGEP